ncbi:hypothetical protein HZA44_04005 [Candidatus Peregrinibacteria bacterium]|nr:hypothetical protein [Candidatus Peregrinibacteria bacterium]
MAINLAFYVVALFGQPTQMPRVVAPTVSFASGQEIFVRTPYGVTFEPAVAGQSLFEGMSLKTGSDSFAEIHLEGNLIRMDQNTEVRFLENHFREANQPRLVLGLDSGSLWVNAFDSVAVRLPRAEAVFFHGVAMATYSEPLNRITSIIGSTDLILNDADGSDLAHFSIPFRQQVAFADQQIIPDYSKLHYSKLKKELKLGPVSNRILQEDWVKRNTQGDLRIFLAENHYLYSNSSYQLKDKYLATLEKLSLLPARTRTLRLERSTILLKYLLGGVQQRGSKVDAKALLDTFSNLISPIKDDPELVDLMERQFYAIQNAPADSPAYMAREHLRTLLLNPNNPEMLRSYLSDLDFLLRSGTPEQALKVADLWLSHWTSAFVKAHPDEFELQARVYHSLMLAYAGQVDSSLLTVLEKAEDLRLAQSSDSEETLFEIALERLDMSKYMVAAARYSEAKSYLRTSYAKLNLGEREASAAAREIFIKDATLLADRIAFAEQSIHASAGPLDEKAFMDYLNTQERDKTLEQRFTSFLEGSKTQEVLKAPPTIPEVSQRFATSRIVVLDQDIATVPDAPFEFHVANARLVDRAPDGSAITFEASYNYSTNGIYDISMGGKPLRGNYSLDDFVRIALTGTPAEELTAPPETNVSGYLDLGSTEEAQRSQVIAQDLAVQLVTSELATYDIVVPSATQVEVTDTATLTSFRITGAIIEDTTKKRVVKTNFNYDSVTKSLSDISLDAVSAVLPKEVPVGQFVSMIFTTIYGKEEQEKATTAIIAQLARNGMILVASDTTFADAAFNVVTFQKMRLSAMPIEFSGTFDRRINQFTTVQSALLTRSNITPPAFASEAAFLFVTDYLAKQGITVTQANIKTTLPAEKVVIQDYVRGDKVINFTFDVANNRLLDISLKGSSSVVKSMTFEEFKLVGGGESTAPVAPAPSPTPEPVVPVTP